jgi:hypothetical protein
LVWVTARRTSGWRLHFPLCGAIAARHPHKVTVPGASPGTATNGFVAQLAEHLTLNQDVVGSSPTEPTISKGSPMFNRAYRRAVRATLLERRKTLYTDRREWPSGDLRPFAEITPNPRWVDTPVPCSCMMCRNPRRNGERTVSEKRADLELVEQLREMAEPEEVIVEQQSGEDDEDSFFAWLAGFCNPGPRFTLMDVAHFA